MDSDGIFEATTKKLKDDELPLTDYGAVGDLQNVCQQRQEISFPSCRLVLTVMGFLGFCNAFSLRISLGVAIVAMVNQTKEGDEENVTNVDRCPADQRSSSGQGSRGGEFDWDMNLQGAILAAFYYGYSTLQVLGGRLADRFGGKLFFGGGILISSATYLLIPTAARWHVELLIALRVIGGVGEGAVFPALIALLTAWIPPEERSYYTTAVYSGLQVGAIIGMLLSGVLCDHGFAGGWPSVFYVFGTSGCIWSAAWFLLCYSSPAEHPRISPAEHEYIDKAIGNTNYRPVTTPWKKILTSPPVWACNLAVAASDWGYFTIATSLPKFLHDILGYNMTDDGLLSSLPFVAQGFTMVGSGWLVDWLRRPGRLSTGTVRKIFSLAGLLLPAVLLVTSAHLGCNRALVVTVLVLALASTSLLIPGAVANAYDLAPAYAATLMGLMNTAGSLGGLGAKMVIGALTERLSTRSQWQNVFYVCAGFYCLGSVAFLVFGSAQEQDWAKPPGVSGEKQSTTEMAQLN